MRTMLCMAIMALAWAGYALLLVVVFWLTHGGIKTVKDYFQEDLQLLIDWFK